MHNNGRMNNEKSKDFKGAMKRLFSELSAFKFAIIIALLLAVLSSILSIISPNYLSKLTDQITTGLVINKDNLDKVNQNIMSNFSGDITRVDASELAENLETLDYGVISQMFHEFSIDGVLISIDDQIEYLKIVSDIKDYSDINSIYQKIDLMPKSINSVVKPSIDIDLIKQITIILIIIYVVSAIFNFSESILMSITSNKFAKSLRSRIITKINKLPLKYFDNNQTGDILSRVSNDVDMIAQSMNQSLSTLVSAVVLFIGTIIMMFITNYIMAITAIVSSLIGFVFMFLILSKSQKYFIKRQKELGNINSIIEETYSNLLVVKAYNGEKDFEKKFDRANNLVYDANRKSQFLSGLMMPLMGFIGNFGYVAVCVVGALLTMNNSITFGVIIAFISYVRLFTSPLNQIAQAMTQLQSAAASSERVFEFLDEEELKFDSPKKHLDKTKVKGNIDFNDVKFSYDGSKMIINGFSAHVKSGEKIALVGPTGAGKTTMVNLLMKFYDINSGDILIDNVSTKDLSRKNIHELFTMVLQDTWLFDGTIKENIRFNMDYVSDDDINRVCDIVGLTHFIKTLPNGINSHLGENDSISAGEKQLITIARGILSSAPFLILDEATSNVDTRTEEIVQKAMDKLMENKTSFIIAHRLSTIKNADLILVINEGNIIEQGTHEDLLKKNGFYAELYNSQFQ